jgi:UDP-N-acetylglucosamine:LPS N-acetylglucosamine transferase
VTAKKRILILTATVGLGHISAARAIKDALEQVHGDECQVVISDPSVEDGAPILLRMSSETYDPMVQRVPELYDLGYRISGVKAAGVVIHDALIVALFSALRDVVRKEEPDVVVSPYPLYQAPLNAVLGLENRKIPLVTVVTDYVTIHQIWFHHGIDLCLVPTEEARKLATHYGVVEDRIRVTGIPVSPRFALHDRSKSETRSDLGWRPDLTTLLAVGGLRVRGLMDHVHVINHSGFPLQLALVAGHSDELYHKFEGTDWHHVAHTYHFVEDMVPLMHAADLVLCKAGGLVTSESLACGLPPLYVDVIPGQEQGNADYVVEHGAGEVAESPLETLEILCHWLENEGTLLAERAENARRLGKPRAALEAAELIWEIAQESAGRRADRSEIEELLARLGVSWRGSEASQSHHRSHQ